ncbi:hypothetical protein DdX_07643 [Ditylenchus destructor]|uniref:Uncharacterized protein n=1 Tax=Ditylenchus destructor TaxID=166010 RepID=A0AAD4R574_9BILA|nr:hypothetical protein DdX_07643 [Ditylenchus destructor]
MLRKSRVVYVSESISPPNASLIDTAGHVRRRRNNASFAEKSSDTKALIACSSVEENVSRKTNKFNMFSLLKAIAENLAILSCTVWLIRIYFGL